MLTLPNDKEFHKKFTMDVKECFDCHQVGNKATREFGSTASASAASTLEAWDRRTKVGPSGPSMGNFFQAIGPQRTIFADWTDRIVKGEAPKQTPPRPRGIERNLVITEWDWGTPKDGRRSEERRVGKECRARRARRQWKRERDGRVVE